LMMAGISGRGFALRSARVSSFRVVSSKLTGFTCAPARLGRRSESRCEMAGDTRGNSGNVTARTVARIAAVFAGFIAFSRGCARAWSLWFYEVIRALGAGRTVTFLNLMPFAVLALSWALVGETIHAYHLVGAALVAGGVYLATRPA
jgi:hypothetical protein